MIILMSSSLSGRKFVRYVELKGSVTLSSLSPPKYAYFGIDGQTLIFTYTVGRAFNAGLANSVVQWNCEQERRGGDGPGHSEEVRVQRTV